MNDIPLVLSPEASLQITLRPHPVSGGGLLGRNQIDQETFGRHHSPHSLTGQPRKINPPTSMLLCACPVITIKIMGAFRPPP
jgi:hypothetical protein